MIEVIQKFGEVETMMSMNNLNTFENKQVMREDVEKMDAKRTSLANGFLNRFANTQQQQQNI